MPSEPVASNPGESNPETHRKSSPPFQFIKYLLTHILSLPVTQSGEPDKRFKENGGGSHGNEQ